MEQEGNHEFETAEQFWKKLEDTVSRPAESYPPETDRVIDDALRAYLALATDYPKYVETDHDLRRCAYELYSSPLFALHAEYIRTQLVHCFLQDDESDVLYIMSTLLLADAREHETTFELLNEAGAFQRMVDLIKAPRKEGEEALHRLLMELLYEMARIQKITNEDLAYVDDDFMCCLFGIIEEVSGNVDDPYHYPVIRILLVLNEQYMVANHHPAAAHDKATPLTNKVIKVLASQGSKYKTFGQNIILLLNREDETSLQLLTLKLLYLLFTTPSTYEYFYTNDLHVLVDILVRNLLDLPEDAVALRHTYLRVLYPLLQHTQLQYPPHYKRDEIWSLLSAMAGIHMENIDDCEVRYFEDVDETTKRLVRRCQTVSWLGTSGNEMMQTGSPTDSVPSLVVSPDSPSKGSKAPPALPAPRRLKKRGSSKGSDIIVGPYLNPELEARQSNLSMMEMAAQREKPGVKTPRRTPGLKRGLSGFSTQKKDVPPPPKARRSGWRKDRTMTAGESEAVDSAAYLGAENGHDKDIQEPTREDIHADSPKPKDSKTGEINHKKAPPAPKARRWRRKHVKAEDAIGDNPQEPGRFTVDLPSIATIDVGQAEQSPFSPPAEMTLSPDTGTKTSLMSKRISSVSAALSQAQLQAIQSIEDTLEKTHIEVRGDENQDQSTAERENHPVHRPVLAPPSQAPMRSVPGPTVELGRSPFLTDSERNEYIDVGALPKVSEEVEQPPTVVDLEVDIEDSDDAWNELPD